MTVEVIQADIDLGEWIVSFTRGYAIRFTNPQEHQITQRIAAHRLSTTTRVDATDGEREVCMERRARDILAAEMGSEKQRQHILGDGSAAYATVTGPQAIRAILTALRQPAAEATPPVAADNAALVERLRSWPTTKSPVTAHEERLEAASALAAKDAEIAALRRVLEGLLHHEIAHVGPYAGQRVEAARAALNRADKYSGPGPSMPDGCEG